MKQHEELIYVKNGLVEPNGQKKKYNHHGSVRLGIGAAFLRSAGREGF